MCARYCIQRFPRSLYAACPARARLMAARGSPPTTHNCVWVVPHTRAHVTASVSLGLRTQTSNSSRGRVQTSVSDVHRFEIRYGIRPVGTSRRDKAGVLGTADAACESPTQTSFIVTSANDLYGIWVSIQDPVLEWVPASERTSGQSMAKLGGARRQVSPI
jgi:hypothetical protein